MNGDIVNQVKRGRGRPPKGPTGPSNLMTKGQYRDILRLTAQQYADREAQKHAKVAADLVSDTIRDMGLIVKGLRVKLKDDIAFLEPREIKELGEAYRIASDQQRRALGLSEDVAGSQTKTLVSIQCVGEVHVSGPEGSSGMKPLPQMPDLSKLLPGK